MQVVMSKKKYIILLFVMLILAATTAAIYLFVNPNKGKSNSYQVDKYSDVTSWCDTNQDGEKLAIDCKALLLNIDANGCFEVQVITKEKELKNLTVCEKNDTLSYTNDILDYKKLMPVNVVFTYTKEGVLEYYSFGSVSFEKIDDTYIQNIVNENIVDLVSIDPSTTTIQNSVDFCPRPETLPSYVTETNKTKYTEYYYNSINKEETTQNDTDDNIIHTISACYSNYIATSSCTNEQTLSEAINVTLTASPLWQDRLNGYDFAILKEISSFSTDISKSQGIPEQKMKNLFDEINVANVISEPAFCALYQVYKTIGDDSNQKYIETTVSNNYDKISSSLCSNILDKNRINNTGIYLRLHFMNKLNNRYLNLFERCNTLINFVNI